MGRFSYNTSCSHQMKDKEADMPNEESFEAVSGVEETTANSKSPTTLNDIITKDDDVALIEERYGTLYEGLRIEIELSDACELFGKTRRRVDAFNSIVKKLHETYGVELIVKSRKTK